MMEWRSSGSSAAQHGKACWWAGCFSLRGLAVVQAVPEMQDAYLCIRWTHAVARVMDYGLHVMHADRLGRQLLPHAVMG